MPDARGAFDAAMARRWSFYRPPARPSPGDFTIYEAAMADVGSVLLLGATPEIRALGRRLGNQIVAVDRDAQVYGALSDLVEGDPSLESFVETDWLHMDLGRRFDLVIGDGSMNMLHPDSHQVFLDNLARHVRPTGRLLLRTYVMAEPTLLTPRDVINHARESPDELYTAVKIHLSQLWLDRRTGALCNATFWGALQDIHRQGHTTEEEHDELAAILANDALTVYFVDPSRLTTLAAPAFDLEDVVAGGDYEASEQKPIFTLRRR